MNPAQTELSIPNPMHVVPNDCHELFWGLQDFVSGNYATHRAETLVSPIVGMADLPTYGHAADEIAF